MRCGVYKITNLTNGYMYVGSSANTARQGVRGRLRDHRTSLVANKHSNCHLQRAWNKYGEDAFVFEIVLYCDPEDCLTYEQLLIDHLQPKYNICPTAGNSLGFRHSTETIEHLKQVRNTAKFKSSQSARMKGNKRCVGRKLSDTTKEKLRQARLKRVGRI